MDSFYRSRTRIFFEVLCALGISASFVGAWSQVGASAFLPAAGIAALYGLVDAFAMVRRRPGAAATVMPVADNQPDLLAHEPASGPESLVVAGAEAVPDPAQPEAEPIKQPRKSRAKKQRSSKPVEAPVIEPAPALQDDRTIEPLFEPQPFTRQLRPAFGRRDRLPQTFAPKA